MDISGPFPRIFAQPNNMLQPGCRRLGEMEASNISEIILLYWWCATNLWFPGRFRTVCTRAYRTFGIMWVGCKHFKNPLLEEVNLESVGGVLWVLNKNPTGVRLPLWRLSCNLTRIDAGLDVAMEDKVTPHAAGGFSSPMRARWFQGDFQHEFQVIPGIGFCCVLGYNYLLL